MIHEFELVKSRAVPKDHLEVDQPIDNSSEFVVSDIFPTDAISQTIIDGINKLKFGEIPFGNKPNGTPWDKYILRRFQKSTLLGFTRLFFSRDFGDTKKLKPYLSYPECDDGDFPAVLKQVKFLRVGTNQKVTREVFIPAYRGPILYKHEFYVSSSPFDIPPAEAPQPGSVSYDFLNIQGRFEPCLHKLLKFNSDLNAIVEYSAGLAESSSVSMAGQEFPATNMEEWEEYIKHDGQTLIDSTLWQRHRIWAFPPDEPELSQQ